VRIRFEVDVTIPRWVKLVFGYVLVPGAIVGSAAVAWAVPKAWSPNEVLTAADLNANFADVDNRIADAGARIAALQKMNVVSGTVGYGVAAQYTITNQAPDNSVVNVVRVSQGIVDVNFATGTFSATPSCTMTPAFGYNIALGGGSSATTLHVVVVPSTGGSIDVGFSFVCAGPR
jgi:hypothetical protein